MRLIDVDEFKQDFNMGNDCESCVMDRKSCEYDRVYSKMDFCEWIDDASPFEIVQCKDCKYYMNILHQGTQFEYGECGVLYDYYIENVKPHEFCSRGEIKQ